MCVHAHYVLFHSQSSDKQLNVPQELVSGAIAAISRQRFSLLTVYDFNVRRQMHSSVCMSEGRKERQTDRQTDRQIDR